MGQFTSKAEPFSSLQEAVMIRYLSTQGPTQYTMELIPKGSLSASQKFRTALKRQRQLSRALHTVEKRAGRRHSSPFNYENSDMLSREVERLTPVPAWHGSVNQEGSIQGDPSEASIIENIQLPKNAETMTWPPHEMLSKILNDPRSRPTSLLLVRLRRNSQEQLTDIEVDYRYSRSTGEESFEMKGNLRDFLGPEAQRLYDSNVANNNICDDKRTFLDNAPYIFNNFGGSIYWNGFLMTVDYPFNNELKIKSLEMEPPSLTFDVCGLAHVSVYRTASNLSLNGFMRKEHDDNVDDIASTIFTIKGKSQQDIKKLKIVHPSNSSDVTVLFPTLA